MGLRHFDQPRMQTGKPLAAQARVARHQQPLDPLGIIGNRAGRKLASVKPESLEMPDSELHQRARDAHMGVSLTGLAVKSARVQSAYVETAQECFPAIDDQKLAVVALQISQRVQQAEGAKPAESTGPWGVTVVERWFRARTTPKQPKQQPKQRLLL